MCIRDRDAEDRAATVAALRLVVAQGGEDRLRDALDQLNSALKADRRLSESTLRDLVELLGKSLKNRDEPFGDGFVHLR